jgi:RNA polymerase sigma-70 factor, ECF subfamily
LYNLKGLPCFDALVASHDEQELRRLWEAGDFAAAAKLAIKLYGHEIMGVLANRQRSSSDAAEVFSLFIEDLWRGLPGFQWRCSLRSWAHRLARHAAVRWTTARNRRSAGHVPIDDSGVREIAEQVRSTSLVYLRSEVKSEVRRLREELPEFEQTLIVLHVDKNMEWVDIAAALADEDLADADLKRESARLRKRFQLAINKLRVLARERGILDR